MALAWVQLGQPTAPARVAARFTPSGVALVATAPRQAATTAR
jgi:hypothetical protein